MGRAKAAAAGRVRGQHFTADGLAQRAPAPGPPLATAHWGPLLSPGRRRPAAADLYLLSTDRSTGQPAPPDGPLNQSERLAANWPGRLAVGLSRA